MDQSAYALGSMTWNVAFVQGDGSIQDSAESWTAAEIANLQGKITDAANYWEGLTSGFHENARLSININYLNNASPLLTGYEPTSDTSEIWINDVVDDLGYTSNSRFTNVRNLNHDSRVANGTHWAATIFIMDNLDQGRASYAYAYHGGPYTILTHNAAGWQPQNFNMVLAHEMGHIFFAHDEYAASNRRVTDRGGYLNVENGNASRDENGDVITPPQPNALMRNNGNFNTHEPYDPSVFSSAMFGHRDTDNDGIPDILDTNPELAGDMDASDESLGRFVFNGFSEVNPLENLNPLNVGFSNSQSAMTINTIQDAFYTINGGGPMFFDAVDGDYDDYLENLNLTLDGLTAGTYEIEIFTRNSVDNDSNLLSFTFNSTFAVPEPGSLALLSLVGLTALGRRRRG